MILKNKFDLSSQNKRSFSLGELIPIDAFPVLPGDVLRGGVDFFTRVAPLNAPTLTKLEVVIESFYCPDRHVWDDAEEFHSGGAYGSTPPVHPTVDLHSRLGTVPSGSLANMLGIPSTDLEAPFTTVAGKYTVNALPFRHYANIYNKYFKHDDLGIELTVSTASGTDTTTSLSSVVVNYKKDYFTGAFARQLKAESVLMEIERLTAAPAWSAYQAGNNTLVAGADDITTNAGTVRVSTGGTSLDPNGGLVLNASEVRDSQALLNYFENAQRRGSNKYSDFIQAAFGVSNQDMRFAEPIKMSYSKDILKFSEVIQTGPDSTDGGVGSMKGHGIGGVQGRGYKQFIPEHGWVLTLAYIRPAKVTYHGGINRHMSKTLKEHYFQPELAHMSQQAISNKEIFAKHTNPNGNWAWQDIYEEYRSQLNNTAGEFLEELNEWHLDRLIGSDTAFNQSFIQAIPSSRIFQDTVGDQFYSIAFNNVKALRAIPKNGMPK